MNPELVSYLPHYRPTMVHPVPQNMMPFPTITPLSTTTAATTAGPGGGRPLPTLPTTAGAASIFQASPVILPPAAGAATHTTLPPPTTTTTTTTQRKRRDVHHLPDKAWDILPESPLFVALQDAERKIDAARNRKLAALTELAASTKGVIEGRAVGDTPGCARKRLRIYIFSRHYNQASSASARAHASASASASAPAPEPPSWALFINGRVLDPDACHPGGGGDPEPPEDARTSRHRFTYYLKRVHVVLDTEEGPFVEPSSISTKESEVAKRTTKGNTVVWEKTRMDHEAKNSFEIRRIGATPVMATITLELDHQPELFRVPAALESLLGLPTGENGAPGLYTSTTIASKVWAYARSHGLVTNSRSGPTMAPDEQLLLALQMKEEALKEIVEKGATLDAEEIQTAIVEALTLPQPLVLRHVIAVDGPSTSPITVLDLHLEVPMEFEKGTKEIAALATANKQLDTELEQLNHLLYACSSRYKEHKRRHTMLTAFSQNPVETIQQLVIAQARELRSAAGKDVEALQVMKSADVYGDKWTQDAILKYLSGKEGGQGAGSGASPYLPFNITQQTQQVAMGRAVQQLEMEKQMAAASAMAAAQQHQQQQAMDASAGAPAALPPQPMA